MSESEYFQELAQDCVATVARGIPAEIEDQRRIIDGSLKDKELCAKEHEELMDILLQAYL